MSPYSKEKAFVVRYLLEFGDQRRRQGTQESIGLRDEIGEKTAITQDFATGGRVVRKALVPLPGKILGLAAPEAGGSTSNP